jgi:hypothetical protein
MSLELRQVANGFAYRVRTFFGYAVNGCRFAQQATTKVGPIEKPRVLKFLRLALMRSSIMKELKKYMNSFFMVPNLLLQ